MTKYAVYVRRVVKIEGKPPVEWSWEYAGDTCAPTESKAINNVRFRCIGKISQYKPTEVSGHYEVWYEWNALPTSTLGKRRDVCAKCGKKAPLIGHSRCEECEELTFENYRKIYG